MKFWIKLGEAMLNTSQITYVEPSVLGSKCGASFEEKDALFVVFNLSCGTKFRIRQDDDDLPNILSRINLAVTDEQLENA